MTRTRLFGTTFGLAAFLAAGLISGCTPTGGSGGTTGTSGSTGTGGGATTGTSGGSGPTSRPAPPKDGNEITGNEIKIGLVASQNGDLRPWGEDSIKGAQLAVDEINKAGGINGMTVRLQIADSNSTPEGGKTAAQKLIGDGAIAILGEVSSGITQQMVTVAFDAGVPVIAIGATKTDLTDSGSNVFRVCYNDDFQGAVMAKFAFEELGLKNVAMMTDNKQPYSQYLSQSFQKNFEKLGGKIVAEEKYESKQSQFAGQIDNLKQKNPEGVFLSGYFNEVGPIASQMRQQGLKVPLFGGDGWDSSELLTSGGDAIVGNFFCNHYNEKEDRPEVKDFLTKWNAKYKGVPGTTMGALGYDAAALVMDAVKRAKGKKSKDVTEAIEDTTDFKGVSGSITLKGQNGTPAKPALVVEVTKSGFVPKKSYAPSEIK
ncbi:MAG: ABC transporter substrate-binding protein [Armatimonadetes bacterium]|nr:ABC transporter substrate-binding protein [Armatimonadota bacterium]